MPAWTLALLYFLFALVVIVFVYGFDRNLKKYGVSWSVFFRELINNFKVKTSLFFTYILGQKKVLRKRYAGTIHIFIFFGIGVLFIGTLLVFLEEDILRFLGVKFLVGPFYMLFEVILDTFGLILVVGILMAIFRRGVLKPEYLESNVQDYLILLGLLYIGVSGFLVEAVRISATRTPWSEYSYIGFSIANMLPGMENAYPLIWWSHVLVAFVMIAISPYTKLFHILLIPSNLLISEQKPQGKLTTPFNLQQLLEAEEEIEIKVGIATTEDLGYQDRIEADACVNCGRCQEACPAYNAGRELSPRKVINSIKELLTDTSEVIVNGHVSENSIWSCVNCYACVEECPAHINHVDYMLDLRRYLVGEGRIDEQKISILTNLDRNLNPYGVPSYKRVEWLSELDAPIVEQNPDFEYLYWIGCAGSIDPRARNVTKAMIKILNSAGVNYAILGELEGCSGEIAKRIGEEGRFQQIALGNIEVFENYGVKKIITHCPHCYNVFKYEYPDLGGNYEVIHHTQLIRELISDGKLKLKGSFSDVVSYHDPCNLGRINGIYEEPRDVLSMIGAKLKEAERSRDRSFCCGGGGGNAFYSVPEDVKISQLRLRDFQSLNDVTTVSVACPFCMSMFEDAKKIEGLEEVLQVKDIAELVAELL